MISDEKILNPAKIYVCMPVYNGQAFIAEAIKSIINQTFTDWELHIVDDCSTDSTKKIIDSFKDNRIKFHQNQKKLGLVRNFNQSIKFCQNEYIYFFHQDDIMKPQNLEEKIKILENNKNVGLVHSNIEIIDSKGKIIAGHWNKDCFQDYTMKPGVFFKRLMQSDPICMTSVMIRPTCIDKLGGFDERLSYCCDYELWMRISSCYDIAYIHKPLIQYRWHNSNVTHRYLRKYKGIKEERLARIYAIKKTGLHQYLKEANNVIRKMTLEFTKYHYLESNTREAAKLITFYLNNYYKMTFNKHFLELLFLIYSKAAKSILRKFWKAYFSYSKRQ